MRATRDDAVVLFYNYAVVLSGGWLVVQFGIESKLILLGLAAVVAVVWTVYFRFGMVSRLEFDEEPSKRSDV